MNRRFFMKVASVVPAVMPVAAREAFSSTGLSAIGPLVASSNSHDDDKDDCSDDYVVKDSHSSKSRRDPLETWQYKEVKKYFSDDYLEELREDMEVTRLDPDLASAKSFSLSGALHIQRERNLRKIIETKRSRAIKKFQDKLGIPFDMSWLVK